MSLEEADKFFQKSIRRGEEFAIFLDPNDAIMAAKRMIDFMKNDIKIIIPFLENGAVNMVDMPVDKKAAKRYIENYGNENKEGMIYQRILDFSEKKGNGRGMWLETYKREDGSYDTIDILTWA